MGNEYVRERRKTRTRFYLNRRSSAKSEIAQQLLSNRACLAGLDAVLEGATVSHELRFGERFPLDDSQTPMVIISTEVNPFRQRKTFL